ncbi:MAG: hypothetical protein J5497_08740 [Selenomonadaceae bacterium]|nr:hypothetical protein [Selenomonadaceae bacterium]
MTKKSKKEFNIEGIIKEQLHSLDDGIQMASQGAYIEGCPLYVVYYDRENKGCLMLDEYHLSGFDDANEERLSAFVSNNPERFIRVPHEVASHDYDLMEDFAHIKKNPKLIRALQGRRPMATFNDLIAELRLDKEWLDFRYNAYDEQFKKWAEEYDIEL